MDIQKVKELALINGFKLKEQASGNMDLNAYVYDFANAIEREVRAQADQKVKLLLCDEHLKKCESPTGIFNSQYPDEEPCLICLAKEAKAQAVPEVAQRQGGYYIRDLRSQPGNCMKFWYQAGYGTKHKKFFWCATLEEAKEYKGGCDWFEIWHAPYIDSLVEYTVDFQLADRGVGLVDLKAQEPAND